MSAAELLLAVRRGAPRLAALPTELVPQTLAEAYAIQHQLLGLLGSRVGGWKATLFDARNGICAPLAADALLSSPAQASSNLAATRNTSRFGVEPEIAFLMGADLPARVSTVPYSIEDAHFVIAARHGIGRIIQPCDARFDGAMLTIGLFERGKSSINFGMREQPTP